MLLVAKCFSHAATLCRHAAKQVAHAACLWVAPLYAVEPAKHFRSGLMDKDYRLADGGS